MFGTPANLELQARRLERSATTPPACRPGGGAADFWRLLAQAGWILRLRRAILVTRGGRRILLTEPLPELPERIRLGSVTYAPTRILDGVKSLSYAANMLARRVAVEAGL